MASFKLFYFNAYHAMIIDNKVAMVYGHYSHLLLTHLEYAMRYIVLYMCVFNINFQSQASILLYLTFKLFSLLALYDHISMIYQVAKA